MSENKVRVCFEYDETARKWEVFIEGCLHAVTAVQAFNAVLLTAMEPLICMDHTIEPVERGWKIIPAVPADPTKR